MEEEKIKTEFPDLYHDLIKSKKAEKFSIIQQKSVTFQKRNLPDTLFLHQHFRNEENIVETDLNMNRMFYTCAEQFKNLYDSPGGMLIEVLEKYYPIPQEEAERGGRGGTEQEDASRCSRS